MDFEPDIQFERSRESTIDANTLCPPDGAKAMFSALGGSFRQLAESSRGRAGCSQLEPRHSTGSGRSPAIYGDC